MQLLREIFLQSCRRCAILRHYLDMLAIRLFLQLRMEPTVKSLLLGIVSILLLTSALYASATEAVTTPNGLFYQETEGVRGPVRTEPLDDPNVLWTRNLATGIFYSTAIATTSYAYTGSGLNDPREAAQYSIGGDGTPDYVRLGNEWEVACAYDSGYWAAVDRSAGNMNTLYLMEAWGDTVWTYDLGFGAVAGVDGMQFSLYENRLIVYMTRAPDLTPRLLVWDLNLQGNTPWVDYVFPEGEGLYARALAISSDGSVIAGTADQYCHVIETDGVVVRDVVDFQASTDALALSADGTFLMSGFQAARLYRWNGTDYEMRWQVGLGSRFVGQLMISPDTTYAVSCWYWNTYDRNYIRVHSMELGWSIWSYQYNTGSDLQDLPVDADMSADGDWFAVGSWGDAGSNNGEAVVFSRWYPTPYFELDMAGSCFSLDLSADAHYLIAAGKHVHANEFGNGGDAYVVDLDLPPEEPLPVLIEPGITGPEAVCFCQDTVNLELTLANSGYESFMIDSIVVIADTVSQYWVEYDSLVFAESIMPGDSQLFQLRFFVCGDVEYSFEFSIYAADTVLLASYRPEFIWDCLPTEEPVNLHPTAFIISAHPNPFNSTASLAFELPGASDVTFLVSDILGRIVEERHSGSLSAGSHHFTWNANDLPSGIYFARLDSRFGSRLQKLILLK